MRSEWKTAVLALAACFAVASACEKREEQARQPTDWPWHCFRHGSTAVCMPSVRACEHARARTAGGPKLPGLTDEAVTAEPTPCMPEPRAHCFTVNERDAEKTDVVCVPDLRTCKVSAAHMRLLAPTTYDLTKCQPYSAWQPEWGSPPE